MLRSKEETPATPSSDTPDRPDFHADDQGVAQGKDTVALPSHLAGSGALDRLVETARDYARAAVSGKTLAAYASDCAAFARWCRMRGAALIWIAGTATSPPCWPASAETMPARRCRKR